jgi:hypothetical protein
MKRLSHSICAAIAVVAAYPAFAEVPIAPSAGGSEAIIGVVVDVAAQPAETALVPKSKMPELATLNDPSTLSDLDLDGERGGDGIVISNQQLIAIMEGSVINGNYNAGSIALSDNAFASFNGVGNIMINSGAQNNLQSGMNLTINLAN